MPKLKDPAREKEWAKAFHQDRQRRGGQPARGPRGDRLPVAPHRFLIGQITTVDVDGKPKRKQIKAKCPTSPAPGDPPCVAHGTSYVTQDKVDSCRKGTSAADCNITPNAKTPDQKPIITTVRAQSGIRTSQKGANKGQFHIDTDVGCTSTMAKRDKCRLQLGFNQGQAFLRACSTKSGKGIIFNVDDPQAAHNKAREICAEWRQNGKNWKFLKSRNLPMGAARRKTLGMRDEQGFDLAEVRRIATLISYQVPVDEIRSKVSGMTDTEFFQAYKAAERYLKQDQDR